MQTTFISRFFKKADLALLRFGVKIQENHERTFFNKTQNGGVNKNGGFW
jgi:hypothetical protein